MPMHIADAKRAGGRPPRPRSAWGHFKSSACLCAVTMALGGCMTVGDKVPPPAETAPPPVADLQPAAPIPPPQEDSPTPTPRPPKPAVREARAIPDARPAREKLEIIDPHRLIGLDPKAVQKLLGAPARVKNDDLSREWVYAGSGCSFRVFFYPNLNSASFRVLKYGGSSDNGGLLDTSDVCVRRILTAKNNAAD